VPLVVVTVDVGAPVTATWEALVDWPSHGRWVPLTDVTVLTDRPDGVGARFNGRTGVGPVGFDDPMEVVEWAPPVDGGPGVCRVVKRGRVVLGSARFEVAPAPGAGSRVTWTYDVDVAPVALTRPFGALLAPVLRRGLRSTLRTMAAEVERAQAGR
jgi:hypothetical protein